MEEYIMIGLVGFVAGAMSIMLYYKTMDLIVNYLKKKNVRVKYEDCRSDKH